MGDVVIFVSRWDPAPSALLAIVASAALYVAGAVRVSRRAPAHPWPAAATTCFLTGLAACAVAVVGPFGAYDDVFFWAHMAQHVLLTLVAAPLLVLGDPVLLVMRVSSHDTRLRILVPATRSRTARFLARPLVGWSLFVGVMLATHVPAVFDFALQHPWVHDYVEHPLYLATALVFFHPLLAPTTGPYRTPEAVRVLALFSVMVPMAFLGFFLYALPHLGYPFYAHVPRPFGPAPLGDQRLAGALMWSGSMVLSVAWVCLAGLRWLRAEERRAHRVDLAIAAGRRAAETS